MNQTINLTPKKRTLIFINLIITCVALSMLSTSLTTALPAIISDLSISVTTGQWLTSGYSLAMAIVMPLTAFLMNRVPTKKLYLSALFIALFGMLLCAVAPNFTIMMLARIFQAVGNGILTSMAQVILLTIYPAERRGAIMGWYGLSITAAPVIAPTLAGIVVDLFNWRAIFYFVAVIVIISMIWAVRVFEDVLEVSPRKFDTLSFALSALTFGGITLGFGNLGAFSFISWQVVGFLLIGVIAGMMFTYRQLKLPVPFLDLRVLQNKNYTLSVIGSMILYLILMGSSMILPLYVQSILGKTATISGLVVLPGSLMSAFMSPLAGKIYDKVGIRLLTIVGAFSLLLSNLGMSFIDLGTSVWFASGLNVLRCVAVGCLLMPFVTWGNSGIQSKLTPHATAILTSLRTVAGAIGIAVFVGIMNTVAKNSAPLTGAAAQLHGMNVTFLVMSVASAALLLMGIFLIKDEK